MTTGTDPHSLDNILSERETFDEKGYTLPQDPFPKVNDSFARSRDLSESTISAIQTIMDKIHIIQQRSLFYCETYKDAVECVESLETTLQLLWGFPYDKNYQTYRFGFKDCNCPKVDNAERLGTGAFIYDKGCVVHSYLFEEGE